MKAAKQLVLSFAPSLVVRDVRDWQAAELDEPRSGRPTAACIGPGFEPGDPRSDDVVLSVLKKAGCPVLVDGGALGVLGTKKGMKALAKRRERGLATVLTPHVGEARRLERDLNMSSGKPAGLACTLGMATGAIVVLKGPDTYIYADEQVWPMREGTAALAKAGTGDVLAGMIGSLMAQGCRPAAAAVLGSVLHARAGVAAAAELAPASVTAEDVLACIPRALRTLSA